MKSPSLYGKLGVHQRLNPIEICHQESNDYVFFEEETPEN